MMRIFGIPFFSPSFDIAWNFSTSGRTLPGLQYMTSRTSSMDGSCELKRCVEQPALPLLLPGADPLEDPTLSGALQQGAHRRPVGEVTAGGVAPLQLVCELRIGRGAVQGDGRLADELGGEITHAREHRLEAFPYPWLHRGEHAAEVLH